MPFYDKGDVRIRYEEAGSGFPLLVMPGGGLNSRLSNWATVPFNAMEEFTTAFHCITMDQRNANGGESSGPIPVDDPWGAFAEDQLGLLDHLGLREFMVLGCCIGGPFVLKLMERAPDRVLAGVLCQPVGHRPENPDVMYTSGHDTWGPALYARRPDVTMATVEAYLHNLYRTPGDFVRACQTPMLIMPDDVPAHPYAVCMEVAALAPKAEVTLYPWKEPRDLISQAVRHVRAFLRAHQPVTAARCDGRVGADRRRHRSHRAGGRGSSPHLTAPSHGDEAGGDDAPLSRRA